jgi:tetratricopeptide (TPR) repeat protein
MENLLELGDSDGAKREIEKYIEENPESPVGHMMLTHYYIDTKDRSKALEYASDWHSRSPSDFTNFCLAVVYFHMDQPVVALQHVNNIVDAREDMWMDWKFLKATLCLSTGDYKSALDCINESIAVHPKRIESYKIKARILMHLGEYAQAEKVLKKLLNMNGDVIWFKELFKFLCEHNQYGRALKLVAQYENVEHIEGLDEILLAQYKALALQRLGRVDEAAEVLEDLQETTELPIESQALLSEIYLSFRPPQLQEAKTLLESVIVDQPKESHWWERHALVCAQLGNHQEAIKSMKRAVELSPDKPHLWLELATVIPSTELKQKQAALEEFAKSGGNSVMSHLIAAEISVKQHKIAEARRHLAVAERVNKTQQELTRVQFLKTIQALYANIGDYSSQVMTLEELLEEAKSDPFERSEAERLLIDAYVHWEKYDDALELIEQYLKSSHSDTFNVLLLRTVCFRKMGDLDKAIFNLTDPRLQQETFSKNIAKMFYERGLIALASTGDEKSLPQATEFFRKATELDPEFAAGWDHLARCVLSTIEDINKSPNALETVEEVLNMHLHILKLEPNNVEVWLRRASLHLALGQRDEARTSLKHVLDVYPNHRIALRLKKDVDEFKMTRALQEELDKLKERKEKRAKAQEMKETRVEEQEREAERVSPDHMARGFSVNDLTPDPMAFNFTKFKK